MNRNIRLMIILGILTGIPTATATELITNGGFETGDTTGWTLYPAFDGSVTNVPHTGMYSLLMKAIDPIEQTFSPAVSTGCDLTFWQWHNLRYFILLC